MFVVGDDIRFKFIDEFKMACRTFSSAQANESLTEEKIRADFTLLDQDKSGSVEFIEVRERDRMGSGVILFLGACSLWC